MSPNKIRGVLTALITPFKNGEVDRASFRRLLKNQLDQGVDGFVVNGTTGESPTLTPAEVRELFDITCAETAGTGKPVIVGTGSNSTRKTAEYSTEVSSWHPDALLVVVPYYNRPTQRGLALHFREVARAASVPILLYNVPGRTVANLEPATVIELSREPNIIGLKDATGDMRVMDQIKAGVSPDFLLLSGDDGTCVDYVSRGGHGVISVSSHVIGREMADYIRRAQDTAAVREYGQKYRELMKCLFIEANPIPVKAAIHWMGLIDTLEMRLPLTPLDEKYHAEFKRCLKSLAKLS